MDSKEKAMEKKPSANTIDSTDTPKSRAYLHRTYQSAKELLREYSAVVPRREVEKKMTEKARKYQPGLKLQGFRKGKVPLDVVLAQFRNELEAEVVREITQSRVQDKMQEEKVKPVGQPVIRKIDFPEEGDLSISFEVEIFPAVDLSDLKTRTVGIPKKDLDYPVFREEENLKQLIQSHGKYEPKKDGKIEDNTMVVFSIQSTNLKNRKKSPRKKERLVVSPDAPSEILDIYRELTGRRIGDRIVFPRRYPGDHPRKPWAGKEIEHHIEIEKVLELKERELNEEFFKQLGVKDLADLKARMKKEYEEAKEQFISTRKVDLILEALSDRKDFPVPRGLLEESIERSRMQVQQIRNSKSPDRDDQLLKLYGDVHRSIKKAFIINSLKQQENIQVDEKKMEDRIRGLAEEQKIPLPQFKKLLAGNQQYLEKIRGDIENRLIQDFLLQNVKLREV